MLKTLSHYLKQERKARLHAVRRYRQAEKEADGGAAGAADPLQGGAGRIDARGAGARLEEIRAEVAAALREGEERVEGVLGMVKGEPRLEKKLHHQIGTNLLLLGAVSQNYLGDF